MKVKKIMDFTADAFVQKTKNQLLSEDLQDWRSLQEKGLLLFRDSKILRCSKQIQDQMMEEHEDPSLITFYLRQD